MFLQQKKPRGGVAEFLSGGEKISVTAGHNLRYNPFMQNIFVTYHKDCIDGTSAAAVALRKFPEAQLFPLSHGCSPEDIALILAQATPGTLLYTVDSGLGAREFLAEGFQVTTIDHHLGAKELFETLARENSNYTYVFDNEKSAATLTWAYLFPDEPQLEMLKYVEDGDLWRWQYGEDTKDITNYLSIFQNDPKSMLAVLEGEFETAKSNGKVISMYADKEIEAQIVLPPIILQIDGHQIAAYNITVYESMSGNILSEKSGTVAIMFTIKGEQVKMSFRSKDGQSPSALNLAKSLGGGGHVLAAGADIPLQQFLKMIV